MNGIILAIAAVAVAGTLASEARMPRAEWLFKPLASACFIALAVSAGAADSHYGRLLLIGLMLCMAGDVALIARSDKAFIAGLSSFLLGHLLYAAAFLQLPLNLGAMLLGLPPVIALAAFSLRWLWPHLPGGMQLPVLAYIGVICTMLLMAGSTWGSGPGLIVLLGAWGFALSDLAVARNQFIVPAMSNRLWGIPLYFGSQLLLAWSPALLQGAPV